MLRMVLLIGVAVFAGGACASKPWIDPGSGWKTVTSKHFVVHTDSGGRTSREVVERFEAVHAALSMFFSGTGIPRVEGLLFASEIDYEGVAGRSAGAFVTWEGEPDGVLVIKEDEDRAWMDVVVAHELAHRFVAARHPQLPAWLHEGLATYLETARHQGNRLLIGGLPQSILHFELGGGVDLRTLSQANADFHGAGAGALYASAWAVVHYLANGAGGANHLRFRRVVAQMGDTPAGPEERLEAFARFFPEKTFDEIDAAAHVHARRMLTTRSEAVIVLPAVPPSPPTINSQPAEPTRVRNLCAEIRQVMLDEDPS
jgi:hypothetical protein